MKKKNLLCLAFVAAFAALTGCLGSDENPEYEKVKPVEPGLYIYMAAQSQNEAALQPADAALRLAILRAEAAKQGKSDELDYVIVEGAGNVKTLLFGANTRIHKDGDDFVITYAGSGGSPMFDVYARMGEVRVRTQGVPLDETDEATPWTIVLASQTWSLSADRTVTLTSTGGTKVYRRDAEYAIEFDDGTSYLLKDKPAAWSGRFVWRPADADDLSFSGMKEKALSFTGWGEGHTFWLLDGKTQTRMRYEVEAGEYRPSLAGNRQLTAGTEVGRLTDPADYSTEAYPAPDVTVKWETTDQRIGYTVTYNGTTVEF